MSAVAVTSYNPTYHYQSGLNERIGDFATIEECC
jgi:hypothetical protein